MALALLLFSCSGVVRAAEWQTIYEGDLKSGSVVNEWIAV